MPDTEVKYILGHKFGQCHDMIIQVCWVNDEITWEPLKNFVMGGIINSHLLVYLTNIYRQKRNAFSPNVFIFLRTSRKRQDVQGMEPSIDDQLKDCTVMCHEKNWNILAVFPESNK